VCPRETPHPATKRPFLSGSVGSSVSTLTYRLGSCLGVGEGCTVVGCRLSARIFHFLCWHAQPSRAWHLSNARRGQSPPSGFRSQDRIPAMCFPHRRPDPLDETRTRGHRHTLYTRLAAVSSSAPGSTLHRYSGTSCSFLQCESNPQHKMRIFARGLAHAHIDQPGRASRQLRTPSRNGQPRTTALGNTPSSPPTNPGGSCA